MTQLEQLQNLLDDHGLAHYVMDVGRGHRICEGMERTDVGRLQPRYIESFFQPAFKGLGGTVKQPESRRYEITHLPAPVHNRDRLIGVREPCYLRQPFEREPDFGVISGNYDFTELLTGAGEPS